MFSSLIRLKSITRLDKKFILHNTFETCCKTGGKNIVLQYIGNVLELYAYFHFFCVFVLCKKFCNCLYCCFSGRICLFFFGRVDLSFFVCLISCCCRHMWPVSLDVIQYSQYCTINLYQSKIIYTSVGVCVLATSEIRIEYLSLNLDGMFGLRWFEARLIIWYGRRLRRVTFSEFRWYKIMLRKGYIQ